MIHTRIYTKLIILMINTEWHIVNVVRPLVNNQRIFFIQVQTNDISLDLIC